MKHLIWRKLKANGRSMFHRENHYLPFVDGLRALAVLLVFGFHVLFLSNKLLANSDYQALLRSGNGLVNIFWQGDKGVDLFFVLSGFLIAGILLGEYRKTQAIDIARYLKKRLARICPALYVMLLLAAAVGQPHLDNAWSNFLFLNNLVGKQALFAPWTWSVAVEIQFYLAVLILVPVLYRWGTLPLSLIMGLIAGHLIYRVGLIASHDEFYQQPFYQVLADQSSMLTWMSEVYIDFFARVGPILIGVLIGCVYRIKPAGWLGYGSASNRHPVILSLLGLVLAGFALLVPLHNPASLYFDPLGQYGNLLLLSLHRMLFAVGIGLIMLGQLFGCEQRDFLGRVLAARCWLPLARVSYSFYLYHIFALTFVYSHMRVILNVAEAPVLSLLLAGLLAMILALLVAALSYVLIEKNFIDWARSSPRAG